MKKFMPLPGLQTPARSTSPPAHLDQEQKEAYEKEWKDVCQYRLAERGDQIFSVNVSDAIARQAAAGIEPPDPARASDATPWARALGSTPWRIHQMSAAPDGRRLAFVTVAVSERSEKVEESEIYSLDLTVASPDQAPRQVTHNEALEQAIRWDNDSRHILFQVDSGSVEGKYQDTQTRLYWVDADSGDVQRWAAEFSGQVGSLHSYVRWRRPGRSQARNRSSGVFPS